MIRWLWFMLFLLVVDTALFSQKILDFDNLSNTDGFTSSKANVIIQDRKGFIWVGTWNGLNRYDGYQCEVFKPTYHDTTTISNREVSALMEDHSGNIWIGTTNGLNCFDPVKRTMKRYVFQQRIISLLEDSNQDIWVGTWNGGLYKLNPATDERVHYLTTDIISDIHEDSRNILWVATYYGLINLDRSTGTYIRYLPEEGKKSSISNSTLTQVVESKSGDLWLGSWGGGLTKVIVHPNRDSIRFEHFVHDGREESLSSDVVYRLFYDHDMNLWVGTWDGGLNLLEHTQQNLSPNKASFMHYKSDLSDPYGISSNNISALFVDRTGVLWVGAATIDRCSITQTGVVRYKTSGLTNGMYRENPVRSFASYEDNVIVGSCDVLKFYREEEGHHKLVRNVPKPSYRFKGDNYVSSACGSMCVTKDGFWVGTIDAGLVLYPGKFLERIKSPDFVFFNNETEPALPGNKITNVVPSKKYPDVLWIGTMQNGFAKLTYSKGKSNIEIFKAGFNEVSISDNSIRSVVEDKDGKVWIGTQNGINYYDPEKNTFKKFYYVLSDTNSINDNVINVIFEDLSGDLWIGTNSGLNKKMTNEDAVGEQNIYFKAYPRIPKLSNEIITNILEDDSLNLWLGLYHGMTKFNLKSESVENEYLSNEYQHVVIERNAALKSNGGTFFLGGANGFISFRPDSLLKHSHKPKVCITDVQIFNESISSKVLEENGDFSNVAIPYATSFNLSYKDKTVTFVFSSMDYKDPKNNTYAYFLEGFDKKWNEVKSRNSATYTNLRPGEYTFKVRAANSDGIWSDNAAQLLVTIDSPWWSSTIAFIFYMFIFLGLLYFFKQYSIIEVREKGRINVEHLQNEKEYELNELKSRFFTNITHEFRTPLTLIVGPAEELLKSKDISQFTKKQADLIQRNAQRLLRLVNQLMEFRTVEKGKAEVFLQKCDVVTLLDDLYASFKSMANSRGIEFELIKHSSKINASVDFEKLERVMFNLVSNAFKYCEDGGKISIRGGIEIIEDEDTLVVEIEDTGIGIAAENHERIFERFFQTNQIRTQSTGGIGLFLSKNFIELHGGTIELESELGQGSCFRVLVPAKGKIKDEKKIAEDSSIPSSEIEIHEQDKLKKPEEGEARNVEIGNKAKTVLIVEDDSELNDFIVSGLSSEFNVVGAFNGREGLDAARKINPDIIITDIMMPEMDGITLCKLLRKDLATSHVPVVFLTAKTMYEDEIEGLKFGAVDYIHKPFNLVSLKLKINNILENRQNIHERLRTVQIMEPDYIELSSLDETFLSDAVNAVNKYLDDSSFDVEKFSEVIGISPNQVYRKIKALTGQTAKEFIRNQRLKTASTLLLQKKRTISEIIYMVGFSSPSYFTRCFREHYGCTPKEFIEKDGQVS